ncbi:MFS transporter [Arthrobacter sp. NPDC093139]|uniref:MFS transporter n=1 Tax=Arthrobacter sp. NPDC093139 TaxID=3363945 RepID=UPI00380854E6
MLIASAGLCQIGSNLARPLVSYKVLALGGDAAAVGLIAAAYALLPVVIALWLGRVTDRSSSLRGTIVAGTVLLAVGPFLLSGAPSLLLIGVASAVLGLGQLCFTIAGQAAIARFLPLNQMDTAFGWFTAAFALGQLVGPLLAGVLMGAGQGARAASRLTDANTALILAGAICMFAVPAAFGASVKRRKTRPTAKATFPKVATASMVSLLSTPTVKANMAASLALLATTDILVAFLPLLGEENGVPPLMVGVLLAIRAGASISSRLLLPVLLSHWSRPALVTSSLAGAAIPLAFLPSIFEIPLLAGALLAIAGFFLGLGQPLTMTLVSQAVPPASRGAALALRLLGNRLGQVTLPLAAGLLAAPAGPGGSVWMSSAVLIAACIKRPRK